MSYDEIKNRLFIRPLNFDNNKERLRDGVYKKIGDMALVLYLLIPGFGEEMIVSRMIDNDVASEWNMSKESLIGDALINTSIMYEPRMYGVLELYTQDKNVGIFMGENGRKVIANELNLCTFTTIPHTNGAVSFWYPGVKERIAEMAEGDYYIAFTGISEYHIHPIGWAAAEEIQDSLNSMNECLNTKAVLLSRYVYKYDSLSNDIYKVEIQGSSGVMKG